MAIDFTSVTPTDDDGSGTTGTVANAAWVAALKSAIDTYVGQWTAVAFSAGDFTGNAAMTVTLTSGDMVTFAYMLIGKMMWVSWYLDGITVGGTPDTTIQIKIPAGKTSARLMAGTHTYVDNGGTRSTGRCHANVGATVIGLEKATLTAWTASTNLTTSHGQIFFEVQ